MEIVDIFVSYQLPVAILVSGDIILDFYHMVDWFTKKTPKGGKFIV